MKSPTPFRTSELKFFTIKKLAERWDMSTRQIQRFIESGDLPAHHIGRSVRIALEDVLIFEARCRRVA
ncbi:MAG: helix-turn-helix domain-containing protein [Proteobacteria bacterium]|nr:helix-turn-helix domain-containing protein [Pseudomonadota bacterium]